MSREWMLQNEIGGPHKRIDNCDRLGCQPVAIVPYEDREQVERLANLYWAERRRDATNVAALQAALREFANPKPPKPDEPQGLGAVVEDAKGNRWVRHDDADDDPWSKAPAGHWQIECCTWDEIDAVRILSAGVES